jgi:hypothetical protein
MRVPTAVAPGAVVTGAPRVAAAVATTPAPAIAAPPARVTRALRADVRGPVAVAVTPFVTSAPAVALPSTVVVCRPGKRPAGPGASPSDALKAAFEILRRDRTDDDTLPAQALTALKQRGLAPVDPTSARLLRSDGAARAWVVPVPDVGAGLGCSGAGKPREGVAVVSVGGAPAGGGGALSDLQRGLAAPALDACAGTTHKMLGVSGIVPDGVEAVFITAADGTATRADVTDNGYAFVLPRPSRTEQRYVVWTGRDGSPHVQPLPAFALVGAACKATPTTRVTPDPFGSTCGRVAVPPVSIMRTRPLALPARPSRKRLATARGGQRRARLPATPAPVIRPRTRVTVTSPPAIVRVAPPCISTLPYAFAQAAPAPVRPHPPHRRP